MGKKAKAPKAPDLVAADAAQVERNKTAATDVMNTNRYTQVNPYASNAWSVDPVTGQGVNTTSLSPREQALYESNNALAQQMTGGASSALGAFQKQYGGGGMVPNFGSATPTYIGNSGGRTLDSMMNSFNSAGQSVRTPTGGGGGNSPVGVGIQKDLDYSKLTAMPGEDIGAARQQAQDALYGRSAGYLDPQWQESQRKTEMQLANQGLTPGTPAYDRAYANLQRAKEQAYTGARQDAIAGGGAEAERAQQMALQLRNQGVLEAGNLGGFHNAAQNQGAQQWLTDMGQKRAADAQIQSAGIGAGASMSNAALANQLGTRNAAFNEAMQMAQFGRGGEHSPTFQTSQGNMGQYGTGNLVNANQSQYQNAVNAAQAKSQGGLGGMLPMIGQVAGTMFGGPLGGMAGGALGSMFGGGGGGIGYGTAQPQYAGPNLPY